VARPVPIEIDFEMMFDVVSSAAWIIFAPVLVLAVVSQCDREHFAAGLASFKTTPGISC